MNNYHAEVNLAAGRWLFLWANRLAARRGTFAAAKACRKRGIPLAVTLLILVGRV